MTAYDDFVAERVEEGESIIIGLYPCTEDEHQAAFAKWRGERSLKATRSGLAARLPGSCFDPIASKATILQHPSAGSQARSRILAPAEAWGSDTLG